MSEIRYILDASALLAMLHNEPGGEEVRECVAKGAAISAVNYCEVVGKCVEVGVESVKFTEIFRRFNLPVIVFDESLARSTGELRPLFARFGLSLADRACLVLARECKVPAVTTDRIWKQLGDNFEVLLVR